MLSAISSFFNGPFFAEYFKDMFLVLIVIAYGAVMVWTRPQRRLPVRDVPEPEPETRFNRSDSAAPSSEPPGARSHPKGIPAGSG